MQLWALIERHMNEPNLRVADLHGRYDLLNPAIEKIILDHSRGDAAKTVTLGDYVKVRTADT
jgi:hypothetical protein